MAKLVVFHLTVLFFLSAHASVSFAQTAENHKTQNVLFVMTDGLRWQEVFRGADPSLMNKKHGGVANIDELRRMYWHDGLEERREALMPFLWQVVAKNGQIYGNRDKGSDAFVTNGLNFSYPGYNETLCGFPDPRVHSNDKVPNPNVTVLEWLNNKSEYHDKVAAFAAWDVFPFIFNAPRAGFLVNAGYEPLNSIPASTRLDLLNHLKAEIPHLWNDEPFDSIPFYTAIEYLQARRPKILYLSLGETDDWAHAGNYGEYLNAAHRVDAYLKLLWDAVQSMPEYRGTTTLIFSPDHGRGRSRSGWKDHGEEVPESKYIWMAFLGPDTPALGERSQIPAVTQSQIAATLAAIVDENYHAAVPNAGKPISDVLSR